MSLALQLPLLRERWKVILAGACFQYVHGMATQLAHRMHRPLAQPLHDLGFDLLPVRQHLSFALPDACMLLLSTAPSAGACAPGKQEICERHFRGASSGLRGD